MKSAGIVKNHAEKEKKRKKSPLEPSKRHHLNRITSEGLGTQSEARIKNSIEARIKNSKRGDDRSTNSHSQAATRVKRKKYPPRCLQPT